MKEYWYNDDWQQILFDNNLDDFDDIWKLKTKWFEPPNIRRGGWSGVVKIDLDTPQGKIGIFIKRQQNHITKTFIHPIRGMLTFEREFKNFLRLIKKNIPTLEPVYFAKRNLNGDLQAILITKELLGFTPLDSEHFLKNGDIIKDKAHKDRLLNTVADTLRDLHHYHFQHNCLYLKHIFIKSKGDGWENRIIDLEKLKRTIFKRSAVFRDLYSLHKHAKGWTTKDHVKLFKYYAQEKSLSNTSKSLWKAIERRLITKHRHSQ